MNMKKHISIILAMLLVLLGAFQPTVLAEMRQTDSVVEQITYAKPKTSGPESEHAPDSARRSSDLRMRTSATSTGQTELTFDKNRKKAQFKIDTGYDLDMYLFKESSPINFSMDLSEFEPDPSEQTRITLRVYDVDQFGAPDLLPEVDKVYCNGTYLGNLTGADSQWSTVTLDIPAGVLESGENNFEVHIDEHSQGWAVQVDWASIELPFNIAHLESIVTDDEDIKRDKTDIVIDDTIWKTEFESNGDVKSPSIDDPIADKINGSWFFNVGSRKFNYEYKLGCWPESLKSSFDPVVKYKWEILNTGINSGDYKEMSDVFNNWTSDFDVTVPDKVGKYELKVSLKIYYEEELLKEENRTHTLYVMLNSPAKVNVFSTSATGRRLTITEPKTAWLDISTEWAKGKNNANDILSNINTKEHTNPFGWIYGYYDSKTKPKEDAITLLENGSGKYSDCYVFRDAWRVLSGSLGVETKDSDYEPGFGFLTSTVKALDNNRSANASEAGSSNHDRWSFGAHALGKYGSTYYDPTFGISYAHAESNIYAKQIFDKKNPDSYPFIYEEVNTGDKLVVEFEFDSSGNIVKSKPGGWAHEVYRKMTRSSSSTRTSFAVPLSVASNSHEEIKYTGNYTENPIDEDKNGLYDYLKLDVEIDAEKAGTYILESYLCSQDGSLITKGELSTENNLALPYVSVELKEGKQSLPIYFKGNYIKEFGADGPYSVKMALLDAKTKLSYSTEIVTESYKSNDFESILLEIAGISDAGTDINGDSLFDTLDFNLNINVLKAGEFTISGMLFSKDGTHLGTAETVKKLNSGKQTLPLKFVGQALRYSEIDGPYTLYIDFDDGKNSGSIEYTSKEYPYTDFQVSDVVFTGKNYNEAIDTNSNNLFDELKITSEVATSVPGNYVINGILQDKEGNFIQSSSVKTTLGEAPVDVQLLFNGTYINKSAVDGPYEVILSLSDEDGNDLTGFVYETNNYKYTDFESLKAYFSKSFTDTGIDSNSDSLFDVLSIGVGVNVSGEGSYILEGTLSDKNENFITSIKSDIYLSAGNQTVNLDFNGGDIFNNAVDGSYILSSLELVDAATGVAVDSLLGAYNTSDYNYSQFQSSNITVLGTPVESAEDYDGDKLYDSLKITMSVSVPENGYYNYNARIVDKNGEEIIWSSNSAMLNKGINQLSLCFDGRYIYGNGENGPYEVKDLTIYSGSDVFSLMDFYTTKAYSWSNFEPISVVYGTASTGYMPIENANIFISGASSDITNSEGKYRLKVINPGSYNIRIDAPSIYEPWEIWINNEKYADGESANITIPESGELEVNFISKAELPPILDSIGNKTVNSNETLEINLSTLEPNGQTVTYSVYNEPKGASLDPISGVFKWTPLNSDTGIHKDIKFTVSDGELEDYETIDITVAYKNRPPVMNTIGNITINENEPLTVSLAVYDLDGDALSCEVYNAPEGSQFDVLTNTFKWIPDYYQAGVYDDIQFTISDGELTTTEILKITVNDVNRAPVLNPIGNITAKKGEAVNINLSASDPDGDTVSFAVYNAPEGFKLDPITNVFTWMPDYNAGKDYSGIRFVVSDGKLSDEETIKITVPTPTSTPTSTHTPTSGRENRPSTSTTTNIEEPKPTIPASNPLQHKAYLLGYPGGYFKPENNITRAEAAAIFANILKSQNQVDSASTASFTDVPENHWAKGAINHVVSKGIFKGYPDGSFKPNQTITRAEFSVAVFKLLGFELSEANKSNFTDTLNHWAKEYIDQLHVLGYIKGYSEGMFKPDNMIKRSECVTLINRALNRGPLSGMEQMFKDVPSTHWAYEEISESAIDHISILGDDGKERIVKD